METTYFCIDAKRIVVCGGAEARRAAGAGGDCYAVIPRRKKGSPAGKGKLLSLEDYRARTEEDTQAPPEVTEPVRPDGRGAAPAGRLPLLLDLLATGAILGMAVTVVTLFLSM